ncbi:unnamed protein product, partial [marine sediment metagenome]
MDTDDLSQEAYRAIMIESEILIMDIKLLDKIKKISIIALVSDDDLMDKLVLKGGNAINLIFNLSSRASIDIEFKLITKQEYGKRNSNINELRRNA